MSSGDFSNISAKSSMSKSWYSTVFSNSRTKFIRCCIDWYELDSSALKIVL